MNRRYKQILFLLVILSMITTINCVSAIDNINTNITSFDTSEVYISPDGDDDLGDGSSKNPYNSLRHAIDYTSNDSTIFLDEGNYIGENNRNISLDKSVTIIGKSKENTIIDCESSGRLFTMNSNSSLILTNLTLKNGKLTDNGGLIYNEGGQITIKNCILSNSQGYENGGAIYTNFGTLNIENTHITNNSAYKYGGAIYTNGETNIKNSTFTQNYLTSRECVGGCIASNGKINLDGCVFSKNFVLYSAAALLNLGNATINNCRFEYLTSNYTCAGISNHNYAIINNSYFGYNEAKYYAAAILAPPSGQHVITKVYNTIFEENHVGFFGAVTNNFKDTELYMENCAIVGNYILNENRKGYGDISLDDNATVQYCWWGQNSISPYYYSPFSSAHHPEKINASRWLVMSFSSDSTLYKNKDNIVTVDLNQYFDNETKEIYKLNESINLPLEVTVYTNSQTLTKQLVNGIATFNIKPADKDDVVYAKINNQILKLDVNSNYTTLIANDFAKYYKSSKKLSIKLVDCYNKGIAGEKVSIELAGKTYYANTNNEGIASFKIIDTPKTFNVKVNYKGNSYYTGTSKSIKVKVVKPTIKASKTTIRKKGKFVVTFKNANKAMKNVKVKFKIKGKTYYKTTNSKGQAKITINLKVNKKYTVKVSFKSTKTYGTTSLTKKIKVIK